MPASGTSIGYGAAHLRRQRVRLPARRAWSVVERPANLERSSTSHNGDVAEARSGYQRSVPGLLGALIVVLVLIASVWVLSRFQHRDTTDPAKTVDYTAELAEARESAPFDVLAPSPVPPGWRAASVQWDGADPEAASWHLGFLTSTGEYVGLEQGNAPVADFVAGTTTATQPTEAVEVAGESWQGLVSDDAREHALVRRESGVTMLVTGTASLEELVTFAESLTAE